MSVWGRGNLNGYDMTPVEMAGRFCGQKNGKWLFFDGEWGRYLPKEHTKWRKVHGGAVVVTVPQWLAKTAKRIHLSKKVTRASTSVADETREPDLRHLPTSLYLTPAARRSIREAYNTPPNKTGTRRHRHNTGSGTT